MATIGAESDRADDAGSPEGMKAALGRFGYRVTSAVLAGMLCGALVGGVGGRLAMFVLRLTSDDRIRGLETDDGFEIGSFTGSTFFLVVAVSLIGVAMGLIYLASRRFVPERHRAVGAAVFYAALGGAAILQPGKFDFTAIEPGYLAVTFFVLLPAAFGFALSRVVERWLADPEASRPWYAMLPLLVLAITGPLGIAILLALAIGFVVGNRVAVVQRIWHSTVVLWSGRAVLGGGVLVLGINTVQAAVDII